MIFEQSSYYREKFVKVTCSGATVSDIEFEACVFTDCSFSDCTFTHCRFINCTFDRCSISAMVPAGSGFVDVQFIRSKIIGIDWTKAQRIQDIHFTESQISYSNFRMLKLVGITIVGCESKETDFTGADLSGGVFTGTDFDRSIFSHTTLTKADFRRARNYYIDTRINDVRRARFSLPEALSLFDGLMVTIE